MKVDGNSRGVFISHDGLTLFFNTDYSVVVNVREGEQWRKVAEMKADKQSFDKLVGLLGAI